MGDDERWRSERGPGNSRETTRAALLDAARRLWAEHGVQGASLHDVAAAAGLTKGAVYSNFTGKADLLLALMEHQIREPSTDAPGTGGLIRRLSEAEQPEAEAETETEGVRMLTLLLVEFWLYGMRDYSAGWRIADWYHAIRTDLARQFAARDDLAGGSAKMPEGSEMSAEDRARMVVAMDLGLVLQHLLDPARVPATACAAGMRLLLEP